MPPSVPAPVPLAATFSTGSTVLSITFDQLLQPGFSSAANWVARLAPPAAKRLYGFGNATILGPTVSAITNPSFPPGLTFPEVDYSGVVPDVIGLATGLPAAAFSNFPLTVLP